MKIKPTFETTNTPTYPGMEIKTQPKLSMRRRKKLKEMLGVKAEAPVTDSKVIDENSNVNLKEANLLIRSLEELVGALEGYLNRRTSVTGSGGMVGGQGMSGGAGGTGKTYPKMIQDATDKYLQSAERDYARNLIFDGEKMITMEEYKRRMRGTRYYSDPF